MPKWTIIAYADAEYGLPKREKVIEAKDRDEAMNIGWKEFPEYHEIGAYMISWGLKNND